MIGKDKHFYINSIIISIISLIHYFITNPLEKALVYTETPDTRQIRRPKKECSDKSSLECIGMPSGHSEVVVILCLLLWNLKIIKSYTAAAIIFIVGMQRIYDTQHTLVQVITGWNIGLIYAFAYIYTWNTYNKINTLLISIIIPIIYSLLLTYRIDKKIHEPTPQWVDPKLSSIIKKKQETSYINKYMYSILPIYSLNFAPYYSWKRLEEVSDKMIDKLQTKSIDVIVGIKSGGAIIASYFHSKMPQTQLYYFKSKRNKGSDDTNGSTNIISDLVENLVLNKKYYMTVIEGIDADISNKNVLLLDETIESGQSMLFAKNYLETVKNVKHVTIAAINIHSKKEIFNIDDYDSIYYSKTENVTIWPWGYDN
jgi:adenine/guanine phosphoribosyltransferase-like PRPP-binding protein